MREDLPTEYLLDLAERGLFINELGHRRRPRELVERMARVHRYPEAILTLGQILFEDPNTSAESFAAFIDEHADDAWLATHLAHQSGGDEAKRLVCERLFHAHPRASRYYAKHLALAADLDALRRFLSHEGCDGPLETSLRDPAIRDPAVIDALLTLGSGRSGVGIESALEASREALQAGSPDLTLAAAETLFATQKPLILWALVDNPATPPKVREKLAKVRGVRGAKEMRRAATH